MTTKTIIRMGAAHYDLRMSVGELHTHVDLAKELHGLPPRERYHRLSGVAEVICKAHGIQPRGAPTPRKSPTKSPRRPRRYTVAPNLLVTMEATL